ncbi:MAG: ABC transporter permease [Bacteroidetes bacterium]|nr:ABC transporter permease [Bacteroidota bacterium]
MRNILTITQYTFKEAFSRKIFLTFFGISSFVLLIFSLIFYFVGFDNLTGMAGTSNEMTDNVLTQVADFFKMMIVMPLFGGGLFLSIFSASSFIPNMLEKGNIDLILSKPVSRSQVIWGKFLGGISIVLLNIAYLVLGIWLLIGLKFSVWGASILVTILSITFAFAVLYALIILIGVLTRSSLLAMMMSYLIFFILSPILATREQFYDFLDNKFVEHIIDGFYYFLPKTSEIASITASLATGGGIDSYQPIISSFLFMILSIGISIFIFSKKDY